MDVNILVKCNFCLLNLCKNDGICNNDLVDFYRCICLYGFKVSRSCCGNNDMKI